MTLLAKRAYVAECDGCHEPDTDPDSGGAWHYESADDAVERLRQAGWTVFPDGRLLCPTCAGEGRQLRALRCACLAGRGTNPGCPVCP